MSWFKKSLTATGSVLFRGSLPPRAEEFEEQFAKAGITVRPRPAPDDAHWRLRLEKPGWGKTDLVCPRQFARVPTAVVAFDPRLTDDDRQAATAAASGVTLTMQGGGRANVLADHKAFLRALWLVMGADGVVALDHRSSKFWTRDMLDDELAHDVDVDIEALFTLHAVYDDRAAGAGGGGSAGDDDESEKRAYWLHSHGLAELGFVDFDVLEPSADLIEASSDATRAVAYAIAEGEIAAGAGPFELSHPGGDVQGVDAATFDRTADPKYAALRDPDGHTDRRVVLCDPVGSGWLARLFGRTKPRPARWMSRPLGEQRVIHFPSSATQLMAERARATYEYFRALHAELAEFELPALVKLGYEVDGGDADDREHLWFEVHSLGDTTIDATLVNQPFRIARMQAGQRGEHPVERLTEWQIMTPLGAINPRESTAARAIRSDRESFKQLFALAKAGLLPGMG
jgi:uncharacterized protein YegJ (DUF2314 family)